MRVELDGKESYDGLVCVIRGLEDQLERAIQFVRDRDPKWVPTMLHTLGQCSQGNPCITDEVDGCNGQGPCQKEG